MIPYFNGLACSWYEWRGLDGRKYDRRDIGEVPFNLNPANSTLRETFKEASHR